jgi:hypothetical protein
MRLTALLLLLAALTLPAPAALGAQGSSGVTLAVTLVPDANRKDSRLPEARVPFAASSSPWQRCSLRRRLSRTTSR